VIQKSLTVGLAALLLWPQIPLSAKEVEPDDLFGLVSALRTETATLSPIPISRTPGTVSIVTEAQIKQMGATSLDEILTHVAGVDAVLGPMGFAGNIRGFGGSPFNEGMQYLIDGNLYNSPDKGGSSASPGWHSFPVPVEMIKQVEVIREPISALYGPNAFYGVVNVITKKGADFENGGVASVRVGNRGSGRGMQRYSGAYGFGNEKYNFAAASDFSREMGPTWVTQDLRITNSDSMVSAKLADFLVSWNNQNGKNEDFYIGQFPGRTGQPQQSINLAGVVYTKDVTDNLNLFSRTSFLSRRGSNCQVCHNVNFTKSFEPDTKRESFYRMYQQFHAKLRAGEAHQVTVGAEMMYDKDHMDAGVSQNGEIVARTYSGFLQEMWQMTDGVSATVGARIDNSDWSRTENLVSPRALMVFNPTERSTYRAGFSMAHRVPTYHDLYAFFKLNPDPPNDFFITGNPTLKPETIKMFTLGSDQWLSNKFLVKANGFFSIITNHIDQTILNEAEFEALGFLPKVGTTSPPNSSTRNLYRFADGSTGTVNAQTWINNPETAFVTGGEVEMAFKPSRFVDMSVSYGYKNVDFSDDTRSIFSREENTLPPFANAAFRGGGHPANAPKHKAAASLTVYPIANLMINVTERYRYKFYTIPSRQNQVAVLPFPDGFDGREQAQDMLLTDFHVRYRFPKGVSLALLGRNVFDQRGREWKNRMVTNLNTGRDFFLEATYEFGGMAQR